MKTLMILILAGAAWTAHSEPAPKEKVVARNHHFELTVGQVEEFLSSQYRMPVHITAVEKRPFISVFSEAISFGQSGAYFRAIAFEGITPDGRHVRASCDLDIGFPLKSDLSVDECVSDDGSFKEASAPLADFAKVN